MVSSNNRDYPTQSQFPRLLSYPIVENVCQVSPPKPTGAVHAIVTHTAASA